MYTYLSRGPYYTYVCMHACMHVYMHGLQACSKHAAQVPNRTRSTPQRSIPSNPRPTVYCIRRCVQNWGL